MNTLLTPLFWLVTALALLEWAAVGMGWRAVHRAAKPGVMLALIAWFTQIGRWQGGLAWFGVGLVFSLLGDILLLLPPRFFISGLAAFLTAHLCYLVGFNLQPLAAGWQAALTAVILLPPMIWLADTLRRGLARQPQWAHLVKPVLVYAAVIGLMLLSALFCFWREGWTLPAAAIASLGALLFFASDTMLTVHRFLRRLPNGDLWVMVTYLSGQTAIAAAALLAYAS